MTYLLSILSASDYSSSGAYKLLLHMDGADASTTFTDELGKTVTAKNTAQIDTAQSVFGGASGLLDGDSDYLSIPNSSDFTFAGDLTMDFRVRFAAIGATVGLYSQATDGTHLLQICLAGSGTSLLLQEVGGGGVVQEWGWTPSTNTWYHVAICRAGSTWYAFVNGSVLTNTVNTNPTGQVGGFTGPEYLGVLWNVSGYLNGWFDEFRVLNGTACWTANFTPPTAPYSFITLRGLLDGQKFRVYATTTPSSWSLAASGGVAILTSPGSVFPPYYKLEVTYTDGVTVRDTFYCMGGLWLEAVLLTYDRSGAAPRMLVTRP